MRVASVAFLLVMAGCGLSSQRLADGSASDRGSGDLAMASPTMNTCEDSTVSWPVTVDVAHADCASRARTECLWPDASAESRTAIDVERLARGTCFVPNFYFLEIELAAGCPTRFKLRNPWSLPIETELVDCLTSALAGVRWGCAEDVPCIIFERDLLP